MPSGLRRNAPAGRLLPRPARRERPRPSGSSEGPGRCCRGRRRLRPLESWGPYTRRLDAGEDEGSGAHRARLQRHVHRSRRSVATMPTFSAAARRREHLRVRGWIPCGARARCEPRPTTSSSRTSTAPIGTSSCSRDRAASSRARRMNVSSLTRCGFFLRPWILFFAASIPILGPFEEILGPVVLAGEHGETADRQDERPRPGQRDDDDGRRG